MLQAERLREHVLTAKADCCDCARCCCPVAPAVLAELAALVVPLSTAVVAIAGVVATHAAPYGLLDSVKKLVPAVEVVQKAHLSPADRGLQDHPQMSALQSV